MDIGTPLSASSTRVMLLGAGELGKEVIISFQRLGVEVIAVDRYQNAPGHQVAHRAYVIDMTNEKQLREIIQKEKPHYIVPEIEAINTDFLSEVDSEGYSKVIPCLKAVQLTMNSSPHNPGGRVWTETELKEVARFAIKNDLILVSDEIHHDLVYPQNKHTVMPIAEPAICDRLVMMTATTKTFNIAGAHSGNVIISNPDLHQKFSKRIAALGISPNSFGLFMATAAYSSEGAEWLERLIKYIDENRIIFDEAINVIPGLKSMPLEGTYLAWVDFSGTGMEEKEFIKRVQEKANIAVNHGSTFGTGGENFLRFNLATPRKLVVEATKRLEQAFSDLQ